MTTKKIIVGIKPAQLLKKGSAEYLAEAIMSGIKVDVYLYKHDDSYYKDK